MSHAASAARGAYRLVGPVRTQADLIGVRRTLDRWRRLSDGLFRVFGFPVGLEILTFVPVAGGLYSLGVGAWMVLQAFRIKASFRTKLWVLTLLLFDVFVGEVPLLGDLIDLGVRAHARMADALEREMDRTWYVPESRAETEAGGRMEFRRSEMRAAGKRRLVFLG